MKRAVSNCFAFHRSTLFSFHLRSVKQRGVQVTALHCTTRNVREMERNYQNAIKIITNRQRRVRPKSGLPDSKAQGSRPAANGTPDLRGSPSITGMSEWLQMLGHSDEDIDNLNIIHVAGTKGKGSTCAFTESFLRIHGNACGFPRKTGMYTSPHLIVPEERIRINSIPLAPEVFAKYFFEVYDKLPQLASEYDPAKPVLERGPRALQIYALLAFHVFIREKVDVAIIETHNGGEYDATNFIENPVVTAVATLGMDHVDMLGPTIENIAWHKAGIFKSGAVALSIVQDLNVGKVLDSRAKEKGEVLSFVEEDRSLRSMLSSKLKLDVQRKNASLAAAAAQAFLDVKAVSTHNILEADDIHYGIEECVWPGRFQTILDGNHTWFLDAAHNEMSVKIAAQWFAECSSEAIQSTTRVLIFSHINELRDAAALLDSLASSLKSSDLRIQHVIFTTYVESETTGSDNEIHDLSSFHAIWRKFFLSSDIWDESTVQDAISRAKSLSPPSSDDSVHTLITGSQHLIGPALHILNNSGSVGDTGGSSKHANYVEPKVMV